MTNMVKFSVLSGETVTSFALGALEQTYFPGEVTRGQDNVDYVFVNGFVDVGDLPCRIATWNDIKTRPVPLLATFEPVALNLPGFNRRLDFSGFWHVPHRLKRWAKTRIFPIESGDAHFRITTCGGVHIWVDGVHITAFEPYQRNCGQSTIVTLPLQKAGSDVVLLVEDMAERDTTFFVEMTWLGEGPIAAGLQSTADPEILQTLMELARSVRPAQVVFDATGPLRLAFDRAAPVAVQIGASICPSVHLSHKPPLFTSEVVMAAGDTQVAIGALDGLPDAYHPLKLVLSVGEARVERTIGCAVMRQAQAALFSGDLDERKAQALDEAATRGEPRMGRVLAHLATGRAFDATARDALDDTLDGIETRRDCSDFVMVPLLWAFAAYADAFPDDLRIRARNAILGYRYWMDEPGHDTMWFWSENHVLCFHVSEYLAGALFPNDVFGTSGLTGAQHREQAESRMSRWYDSVEAHGLAEWNSAAYYPIDFIGLFAMHQWGKGMMKQRATALLDQLFTMIALHTSGGVSAGTMGRAYDKELRAGPLSELPPFAAVAFGRGWLNEGVAALPQFCISDYTPPDHLVDLAQPKDGTALEAHYVQGYGTAARLALHKTAHVQLSASVDGKGGAVGHQQHLIDLQMAARPFARIWLNHPGEDDPWGSNRPSYWAGNGIMPFIGMTGNRSLFLSTLGASPRLAFTHAYAPLSEFDDVHRGEDWMVLRAGSGVAILKATGPILTQTTGPGTGLEHRVLGSDTGWAVVAGDANGPVDSVCARAADMRLIYDERGLILNDPCAPSLRLDPINGLFADGVACPFPTRHHRPQITAGFAAPSLSETPE